MPLDLSRPRLVANAWCAWRFLSVKISALGAAIQLAYLALPEQMKESIPRGHMEVLAVFTFVCIALGRLIKQNDVPSGKDGD